MNVALFSDIHDQENNLLTALALASQEGCEHLLFMGDMVEPETFRTLRRECPWPIDLVFGNNEIQRGDFLLMARTFARTTHHGDVGDIQLDGRRIGITHYPVRARALAESGRFDAVFFGHTHVAEQCLAGSCLLANPGELAGRRREPGFAVYSTEENAVRFIALQPARR